MKIEIIDRGLSFHKEVLFRQIAARVPVSEKAGGLTVKLIEDKSIGAPESYLVRGAEKNWEIVGADTLGVFFGIGKFLHSATWSETDFAPATTEGVVTPACPLRMVYFSIHFFNFYQMASKDELRDYLESLLLWGYNTFHATLPRINAENEKDPVFTEKAALLRDLYQIAKTYGMKTSLAVGSNQGFKNASHEFDADMSFNLDYRGNLGRNLCIHKPGAMEYLRDMWRAELECFRDIGMDYVTCWPYDEGGCGCAQCRPWGANGYLDMVNAVKETARSVFPNVQVIVSTWAFDMPNDEGEYAGLYRRLGKDLAWLDYLLIDAHGDFPKYPLTHTAKTPIINFPEISMWGLAPWGGFGADPLPERYQKIWDSSKHILSGGMPYSEGIYEDISKVQFAGYYWHPDQHYSEILAEYIRFEYDENVVEDTLELMRLIEINHAHIGNEEMPDMAVATKAAALAKKIDARLSERAKNAWRWRILYIRAMLDEKRYRALVEDQSDDSKKVLRFHFFSGEYLLEDKEAQDYFAELWKYYHCIPHNGENHHTLPPLGGTKLDVVI